MGAHILVTKRLDFLAFAGHGFFEALGDSVVT
jgi:hypothetical protein